MRWEQSSINGKTRYRLVSGAGIPLTGWKKSHFAALREAALGVKP